MEWTLGTAHWLRIPLLAQRVPQLLLGESRLAARTHGPSRRIACAQTQPSGGWKHLSLGAEAVETLKPLRYLEWKHSPSSHTVLNRAPSLSCMLSRTRAMGDARFVVSQRGSQLHQLHRVCPLASSSAPPSGLGSQRPCALAADLAPEVRPSPCRPHSCPRNRASRPRSRAPSPRNRATSLRNRATSSRNRATSPRIAQLSSWSQPQTRLRQPTVTAVAPAESDPPPSLPQWP